MARITTTRDSVAVEGDLMDADEERFAMALEKIKRSRLPWTSVDLGGVGRADLGPIRRLVYAWFEMFCQNRPPHITASDVVWQMLGEVALDAEIERWKADAGV